VSRITLSDLQLDRSRSSGHHSLMSASDAAPLPRLGEVFFDVRGSSRSMRLSWYSDTGVAVFSIWQGGMCTGTFRLPIGDLPRMIEILQRGPHGEGRPAHGADEADWGIPEGYAGQREHSPGGPRRSERDARLSGSDRSSYRDDDLAETAAAGFSRDDLAERYGRDVGPQDPRRPAEYGQDHRRSGYGQDDLLAEPRQPGYDYPGYPHEAGEPRRHGYERDPAFPADQGPDLGGPSTGWDAFSDGPYPGYETQPPARDAQSGWGDPNQTAAGYGQERFVPPYVRPADGDYPHDIPGPAADLPTAERRAAYRGGVPAGRSEADAYREPSWAQGGYSDREQYRLPGAPVPLPDRWTEHQSAGGYPHAGQPEPEPGGYSPGPFPADGIEGEITDFRSRRAR
jgi:hypothetical protein